MTSEQMTIESRQVSPYSQKIESLLECSIFFVFMSTTSAFLHYLGVP